ncbi:hypothetical protein EON65_36955 [archaeon]|nr:MAG: hypothetical protein EON65_36955 [archaeon]
MWILFHTHNHIHTHTHTHTYTYHQTHHHTHIHTHYCHHGLPIALNMLIACKNIYCSPLHPNFSFLGAAAHTVSHLTLLSCS